MSHPLAELVENVVVSLVVLLVNQTALLEQERQSPRAAEPPVLAVLQLDVLSCVRIESDQWNRRFKRQFRCPPSWALFGPTVGSGSAHQVQKL